MKAIEPSRGLAGRVLNVVRKVVKLAASRRRDGDARALARARARERAVEIGERATVKFLAATTVVTRGLQKLPVPRLPAGERVALSAAAAQLRVIAESPLLREAAAREDADAAVERALSELVIETLALVDRLLAEDPAVAGGRPSQALPPAPTDPKP